MTEISVTCVMAASLSTIPLILHLKPAISGLFGPPVEAIAQVVESKLSRSRKSNPILMEKNMLALEIAKQYVTEQLSKRDSYHLGSVVKADRVVLNGNQ